MAVRHDYDPKALMQAMKREPARSNGGLTPRVRRAIDIIVFGDDAGTDRSDIAAVATAAGLKSHRTLWEAIKKPAVDDYYRQQLAAKKTGLKAMGLNTIEDVMRNPELRKTPAGNKVRTDAAKVVLHEPAGSQVNVQVNNTVKVTPGYAIVLNRKFPRQIDHEELEGNP